MLDTADDANLPLTSRERDTLRDVSVALRRVASTLQMMRGKPHDESEEAEANDAHSERRSH